MTRTYEKKKRAEREAETRQRIVEATVALHTSVGPARTTISAIAEKAGVQRHTVYSHFPEQDTLFAACTRHWARLHPFPTGETWEEAADPLERLALVLGDVWAWYADAADELEIFYRDAELVPAVRADMTRYAERLTTLADRLTADLGGSSTVRAAVGHALAFETWRSLVRREGLTTAGAIEAMSALVERSSNASAAMSELLPAGDTPSA